MVNFNVTILSHPNAFTKVSLAVLLLDVYVFPSVQVYGPQEVMVSVEYVLVLELMVKFNVTTESQPATLVKVYVAMLLLAVYVFPSIQV